MKKRLFDIGKMRQRVSLYAVTRTDDGAGGFTRGDLVETATVTMTGLTGGIAVIGTHASIGYDIGDVEAQGLIGTYWGNIDPISARERQWGIQFTEVTTHVCWLRFNSNVYETQVVRCNGVTYYVEKAHDPDRLKEFIVLTLREGGPM